MKFLHILKQDLNKTIINIGFAGAALMTFGLRPMKEHYAHVNEQTGQVTYFESK